MAGRLRAARAGAAEQVASLARDFDAIVASAESVAVDDEHDPEGHTLAWERQQIAALLHAAKVQLADLDDALTRVDAGSYGTCDSCGQPIPPERLAALPAVRTCVTCTP